MIKTRVQVRHLATHIENIRYGEPGTVFFDFKGTTNGIKEPVSVLLDNNDSSRLWIAEHYTEMLQKMDDTYNIG